MYTGCAQSSYFFEMMNFPKDAAPAPLRSGAGGAKTPGETGHSCGIESRAYFVIFK